VGRYTNIFIGIAFCGTEETPKREYIYWDCILQMGINLSGLKYGSKSVGIAFCKREYIYRYCKMQTWVKYSGLFYMGLFVLLMDILVISPIPSVDCIDFLWLTHLYTTLTYNFCQINFSRSDGVFIYLEYRLCSTKWAPIQLVTRHLVLLQLKIL